MAFSGIVFASLQNEIEKVYLPMNVVDPLVDPNAPKLVDNTVMQSVLSMIGDVIGEFDLKDGYYHIPVDVFNQLIQESDYTDYDLGSIKEWLANPANGYIKCGVGRLTNLVRIKDKPTRVISFKKKK